MNAAGNTAPVHNTTLDAKATADGEDVITSSGREGGNRNQWPR